MLSTIAVLMCALALIAPSAGTAFAAAVGEPAPDFELPIYGAGKNFKMADVKGKKAVVLAVTQSACASCRSELQLLNGFVGTIDNVEVMAITVDARGGTDKWNENMGKIIESEGFKMPFLVDPKYSVPRMFGVRATPSLVVIDKNGIVKALEIGFVPGEDNEKFTQIINSVK